MGFGGSLLALFAFEFEVVFENIGYSWMLVPKTSNPVYA